jgi:hypothetical protein
MRIPSLKLGRMVECESTLEGDVLHLLEFSPGVKSYREQPARIEYWDGSNMRTYYPDFEAVLVDGHHIHIEVKHSRQLLDFITAEKYRRIAEHYAENDAQFCLITEEVCRSEPLRSNLRRLIYLRTKAPTVPALNTIELRQKLGLSATTLGHAEQLLGKATAHRALAFGLLEIDLCAEISADCVVTVSSGGSNATLLF